MSNTLTKSTTKKLVLSRKNLTMPRLIQIVQGSFKRVTATRDLVFKDNTIPLVDCLMSGLAVFSLKFPSLLGYDNEKREVEIEHNLRTLYLVNQAPSDSGMRERLDEVDPRQLRDAFKKLFSSAQETKLLQEFEYIDGHYLLSSDGTGFFSSNNVFCENCCIKRHGQCIVKFITRDPEDIESVKKAPSYILAKVPGKPWELIYKVQGEEDTRLYLTAVEGLEERLGDRELKELNPKEKIVIERLIKAYHEVKHPELAVEYYHQMYCGAIVHPDKKTVLPFAPEPILKSDGNEKNDCERNASKRFYEDFRREHPHLKVISLQDGLGSNAPNLDMLESSNIRYIIGAKPGDHKSLFDTMEQLVAAKSPLCQEFTIETEDKILHRYRFVNNVQLNDSDPERFVNFLQYWQTKPGDTKALAMSWVTDLELTRESAPRIMRAGRARWKIENETFNTLKNQGYHFEHNFGHGKKHLSSVFASLMLLAFFIDQVCEAVCAQFQKARDKMQQRTRLWVKIRGLFTHFLWDSWEDLYRWLTGKRTPMRIDFSSG